MELSIRCKVYPGQFSGEFAVSGAQYNGEAFSLFVPERLVATDETVTRDSAVDGWLKAKLYERDGDLLVVNLPRESLESGRFVTVSLAQVKDGLLATEARP